MADTASPLRVRAQLAVAAIFALGVIFGLALSFVLVHHVVLPGRTPPREGPVPIDRMARELGLDPEQEEKIRAILERGHAHVGQVLEDTGREVRALLRPDQQELFDRMRPRSPFGHGPHGGGPPGHR
jgi:hypothetical protein